MKLHRYVPQNKDGGAKEKPFTFRIGKLFNSSETLPQLSTKPLRWVLDSSFHSAVKEAILGFKTTF